MYLSVAAGDTLAIRPPTITDVPQIDFWNLFWAMFERSPVGVLVAGVFTPSQISDEELAVALEHCPPIVDGGQRRTVIVNRGMTGNNPAALRFDTDGLSTFEFLLKSYPCVAMFSVTYTEPKLPGVTGTVSSVSSGAASFPLRGIAVFTPQFDAPGIGLYHWSLDFQDRGSLTPLLKQLCPNAVFK
jgi:hypothetical protein